ncbi:hypothetical protein ACQR3E_02185 [Clostridium perfringens]
MDYKFIGKVFINKQEKGTCFLINKNICLTSDHLFKDSGEVEIEICGKKCTAREIKRYSEVDLAIIEINEGIEEKIEYLDINIGVCVEKGEKWKSYGYPLAKVFHIDNVNGEGQYVDGEIYRDDLQEEKADIELKIDNLKEINKSWGGISGAPLIVENKIVGIIRVENNDMLSLTLKAISFQKIMKWLHKNDKHDVLNTLNSSCNRYYEQRKLELFSQCNDIFIMKEDERNGIKLRSIILRPDKDRGDIDSLVDLYIEDYAFKLKEVIEHNENLKKDGYINRITRRDIRNAVNDLIGQIEEQKKELLPVLWIISEGVMEYPRIAKTFMAPDTTLTRDVFLKKTTEDINLLVGYVDEDEQIETVVESLINKVIKDRDSGYHDEQIIISGELENECLDFDSRMRIENRINKNIGDKIEIDIIIMSSCKSEIYNQSSFKLLKSNEHYLNILYNDELNIYFNAIENINSRYEDIKIKNFEYIHMPLRKSSN